MSLDTNHITKDNSKYIFVNFTSIILLNYQYFSSNYTFFIFQMLLFQSLLNSIYRRLHLNKISTNFLQIVFQINFIN